MSFNQTGTGPAPVDNLSTCAGAVHRSAGPGGPLLISRRAVSRL